MSYTRNPNWESSLHIKVQQAFFSLLIYFIKMTIPIFQKYCNIQLICWVKFGWQVVKQTLAIQNLAIQIFLVQEKKSFPIYTQQIAKGIQIK